MNAAMTRCVQVAKTVTPACAVVCQCPLSCNRARQLYKNISMLCLFPVKDGKLSQGVIAIFNASCYC